MATITIYSTPSCTYCKMLKSYLGQKNVAYTDFDVSKDQAKAEEMVRKSGQMGVPVVDIDGKIIVGFNKPEIDRLIGG